MRLAAGPGARRAEVVVTLMGTPTDSTPRAVPRRRVAIAAASFALTVVVGLAALAAAHPDRRPVPARTGARLTDVMSQTLRAKGTDAAVAEYRRLRGQGFPGVVESEADTNRLGYALLRKGDKGAAVEVLRLNAETHPASANVHDSLGEAYLAAGRRALAIESYEKAVALAPGRKSAVAVLQSLTGRPRPLRPLVLFHVLNGTLGVISGGVAIALRKGSRRHAVVGQVFVVSMLSMSASAVYMALVAPDGEMLNALMGVFTFYLVATSWWTARRRQAESGALDAIGFIVALALAGGFANHGFAAAAGEVPGMPAGIFFFFGCLVLLAAWQDLRMIVSGGVAGSTRLVRHLWRMCTALFIAVGSLFLGQPQVFPEAVRRSGLRGLPPLVVVAVLVFWLIRVRRGPAAAALPRGRRDAGVAAA
jgi:uncharacterized membrane protein